MYPDKVVALVESEKSALIASGVYPEYIWLATGGKSQLSIDKLKVLQGRTVIMFPDVDGFEYWSNLSESTVTEVRSGLSEAERNLQIMTEKNPALQLLIDTFDLKLIA